MIKRTRYHTCELAVVGAGIAGCAATVFARARGIQTTQIGSTGALSYTSGLFDLFGVAGAKPLIDPWRGINALRDQEPNHPYAKLSNEDIRAAFEEFITALADMGLEYTMPGSRNHQALLPAGAVKPTFCLPATMRGITPALQTKARVLIIDFAGLQGFSANEIVANLSRQWPGLRAKRIEFPGLDSHAQLFPEVMARALEVEATRVQFAKCVMDVAGDAEYIAMPAILGIHNPDHVHKHIEEIIGLPVFEIPTIPPAVAGIRLRELFEQQLTARGAMVIGHQSVRQADLTDKGIKLHMQDNYGPIEVLADKLILASGRFLSRGLVADRTEIREALLNLPVQQPEDRAAWFSEDYFTEQGHAINRSGVRINDDFQAVDDSGRIIDKRLYAAGILLANQDWIRQRCGAGLAIATAFGAVRAVVNSR